MVLLIAIARGVNNTNKPILVPKTVAMANKQNQGSLLKQLSGF